MIVQNLLRELRPDVGRLESAVEDLLHDLKISGRDLISWVTERAADIVIKHWLNWINNYSVIYIFQYGINRLQSALKPYAAKPDDKDNASWHSFDLSNSIRRITYKFFQSDVNDRMQIYYDRAKSTCTMMDNILRAYRANKT